MSWLNRCDIITLVDFNASDRIKTNLKAALRVGYLPISLSNLKSERQLYDLITTKIRSAIEVDKIQRVEEKA